MLAEGKGAARSNRGHGPHQKTGLIKGEACLDHLYKQRPTFVWKCL